VVRDSHATVSKVMATQPLNVSFRRALMDDKLVEWHKLVAQIANVVLVDSTDTSVWNLTCSGSFTVRSMYLHFLNSQPPLFLSIGINFSATISKTIQNYYQWGNFEKTFITSFICMIIS
jgi:hypothetical protein